MYFPVSGVEASPIVPLVGGFALATLTTPVGVSGAFLLLPFQVSVLGYVAPGVTPTNLLFNVFSTPGAISRYIHQGCLDWHLARTILAGAIPGIIGGSILRVTVFAQPDGFKIFVGVTLIVLGSHLSLQARRAVPEARADEVAPSPHLTRSLQISLLGGLGGTLGGIYGISGGSIIAPALVGIFGISIRRVAPAALIATLITSMAGVVSFLILDATSSVPGAQPDSLLAVLFGIGGIAGGQVGARLNLRVRQRALRVLLGSLAMALGVSYVVALL